ncbi:MAG: Ppx/GppA phosphatase family protein [Bryobacterales bacterium]|nr:Ppx/GppA phosphatase family protein [Bryobacterales bacterium]
MPRYAAIDIGSNSVRMLAAEANPGGGLRVLAEDRQVTRIGESVFAEGVVSQQTLDLVMSVLRRMRKTIDPLNVAGMRAVATSAVRDSRNQREFLRRANAELGIEVEIISGLEEARLIHHGVVAEAAFTRGRQLLIDIGGGSAEFILNENGTMKGAYSKPLGAVRLWQSFLSTDPATPQALQQLEQYIGEKIHEAVNEFGTGGIDFAIGTSASASAAVSAIREIPRAKRESANGVSVSREELARLYRRLAPMTVDERRDVTGIGPRRAEIIVPGVALLARALEKFGVGRLVYSNAGVRDGIVLDLAARGVGIERMTLTDEQRAVVEGLANQFGVSLPRAREAARFALDLYIGLEQLHQLPHTYGRILEAAAYLHDIGHFISATRHHKHSHYIVSGVDLPSFTESERRQIAVLCRYHRKSMPVASHEEFTSLPDTEPRAILCLIPLLRIADACGRSAERRISRLTCQPEASTVTIELHHVPPLDLELWAIERNLPIFREVYRRGVELKLIATPRVAVENPLP